MKPVLVSLILNALLILLILFLIQRKQVIANPPLLALFFSIYFLDDLAITLANKIPGLQILPNQVWDGYLLYGWSGKLYSTLLVAAFVYLVNSGLAKEEVGLTFRQTKGFLIPVSLVVLALSSWALIVGICSPKGQQDFRFLVYLAVMPGLNEELVYRGYLLAILNRLMPPNFNLFSAPVGWGVIVTSAMFGLLHGVWFDSSLAFHLDMIALRNSTFSGLIFAWLRERTGSLLVPVVAHGLEDVLFFLPRMV